MPEAIKTLLLAAIAATTLTLAAPGTAHAQRESKISGEVLNGLCSSTEAKSNEGCEAYIDGVIDAALTYQQLRPIGGPKGALPAYLCVPGTLTGTQLRQAYVDAYKRNPQPNRFAAGIILSAFSTAYPCAATPRPTH